jgi:hypothetical protein
MSREELIREYEAGRLSRRAFVKGLAALGVSGAAAIAYANMLGPTPTPPAHAASSDLYGDHPGDHTDQPPAPSGGTAAGAVSIQPNFAG